MKIRPSPFESPTTSRIEGAVPVSAPAISPADEDRARALVGVSQPKVAPSQPSGGPSALLALRGEEIARGREAKKAKKRAQKNVGIAAPLDGSRPAQEIRFRSLSGVAQHLIRQLEKTGSVNVQRISPTVMVEVSKFFSREVALIQNAETGQMRFVLGTANGILKKQMRPNESVLVHTHPVYSSRPDHFHTDFKPGNGGKYMEAVVDWSGTISFLQDGKLLNPLSTVNTVEPMEISAPFMDASGDFVGYRSFTRDGEPQHKRSRQ